MKIGDKGNVLFKFKGRFVVCVKDCVWKIIKVKSYARFIPGSKEKASLNSFINRCSELNYACIQLRKVYGIA